MFERFSPSARQVISEARLCAEILHHTFIGTEHLLLGLLAVNDGLSGQILEEAGVGFDRVHALVKGSIPPGPVSVKGGQQFTPLGKQALEQSLRRAIRFGHDYIDTEHILLGLLDRGDGVAGQFLHGMGVTAEAVEQKISAGDVSTRRSAWRKPDHRLLTFGQTPSAFPSLPIQLGLPSAKIRNQRMISEIAAIISENETLRTEVDRLRRLLEQNRINPDEPPSREQLA